jgi:hypothetical protein
MDIRVLADRADRENLVVVDAERDAVFILTGHFTGKAPDAAVQIDY